MKIRTWPDTMARQIILILFGGVTIAMFSSTAIHLQERSQALFAFGGMQTAQRFATIIQLLDPLTPGERRKVAAVVETPLQFLRFLDNEQLLQESTIDNPDEQYIRSLLKSSLGEQWPLRIAIMETIEQTPNQTSPMMSGNHSFMGMGKMRRLHHNHMEAMNRLFPHGISFLAQVQLSDGTWAEFHSHLPKELFSWPRHLILSLIIIFVTVSTFSLFAIRLATRPLSLLAKAAQGLGNDIKQPPLAITGPREVRRAASAFNTMQARIIRYIQERTHLLAAISHDLKTPLTRMRLRVERLVDHPMQPELLRNIAEVESLAMASLDYIQGMEGMEQIKKVDVLAMLERIQEEFAELGGEVAINCQELAPFPVMPKSLKRCLTNLIANAIAYGERARVRADILGDKLRISISDDGPGIPEEDFARVLEPFVRLEESRNRKTGGTGLGLSISRNIIRAHGGDLNLRNRPEGGLEIIIILPLPKSLD